MHQMNLSPRQILNKVVLNALPTPKKESGRYTYYVEFNFVVYFLFTFYLIRY